MAGLGLVRVVSITGKSSETLERKGLDLGGKPVTEMVARFGKKRGFKSFQGNANLCIQNG
jgi:hypothetical protein